MDFLGHRVTLVNVTLQFHLLLQHAGLNALSLDFVFLRLELKAQGCCEAPLNWSYLRGGVVEGVA